jgi:hypothetical protein
MINSSSKDAIEKLITSRNEVKVENKYRKAPTNFVVSIPQSPTQICESWKPIEVVKSSSIMKTPMSLELPQICVYIGVFN